ncbi:MAG: hypothetical protein HRT51_09330 [Colwellia sp.]|nr:hypothetical protein [Colwellia sp.]
MNSFSLMIWVAALIINLSVILLLPKSGFEGLELIFKHVGPLSPLIIPVCLATLYKAILADPCEYPKIRWIAEKNSYLGVLGTLVAIVLTYARVKVSGEAMQTVDFMGGFSTSILAIGTLWLCWSLCPENMDKTS